MILTTNLYVHWNKRTVRQKRGNEIACHEVEKDAKENRKGQSWKRSFVNSQQHQSHTQTLYKERYLRSTS